MGKILVSEKEFLKTYKIKGFGYRALNVCEKNNWLPMKSSPFLASIVGRLMGDGTLSKDRMVGDFRFYGSTSKLEGIREILEKEFRLLPHSYYSHPKGGCYILRYNNAIFARILELVGVPRGNKVLTIFKVPNWIMKGNKKIKKSFLSVIFADEMSKINKNCRGFWNGFEFGMSKSIYKLKHLLSFLEQLRKLVGEFGVTSSKIRIRKNYIFYRKDGNVTYPARFSLHTNILNRKRFYFNIGFDDEEKQKLLYKSLKGYFTRCGSAGEVKPGIWKKP